MEYIREHIVSDNNNLVFLHRTNRNLISKIMEIGLASGGDITSTATMQPRDIDVAIGLYKAGKDHGDMVVVVKIPREEWNSGEGNYEYLNEIEKNFFVKPQYISGWIDRKNNMFYPNTINNRI